MKAREDGAVLLVVLVALALLAAMAGVALRLGQAGLHALAAERAVAGREVLVPSALALLGVRLGEGSDMPRNGDPVVLDLPGGRVEVRVQAAEGLVNPDHARLPILQTLFTAAGASPEQALRLARAISDARQVQALAGPEDVAPLFAGDQALWPKVARYFTFLGTKTTVDPMTAPAELQAALAGVTGAGVDITQGLVMRGFYEIDLRVLAPDETVETARGLFTHVSVLRDKAGRLHVFRTDWPQEGAGA